MIHTLTRWHRRTGGEPSPEYLPPYFYHRYFVWRFLFAPVLYIALVELLDLVWEGRGWTWNFLLSLTTAALLFPVPYLLRRRWVKRELRNLSQNLRRSSGHDQLGVHEGGKVAIKYRWLTRDFYSYACDQLSPLSVRKTPWAGDGTRYTVYQRGRPKRVFTFYHES